MLVALIGFLSSLAGDISVRVGRGILDSDVRAVDLMCEDRVGNHWIRIPCESKIKLNCHGPGKITGFRLSSPAKMIHWNGKLYHSSLTFESVEKGCDVINTLDIESYLDGLVNTEFNSKWNVESVKAQVVVARTYALYQAEQARKSKRHYDLDSSTDDQVYDGFIKEDFVSSRAVDQTRGLVLKYKNKLFSTYYHSTCGGMTELPEIVWGSKHPVYSKRITCSFCQSSPKYKWSISIQAEDILKKLTLTIDPKTLHLALTTHPASGRVVMVTVMKGSAILKKISGVEFRKLIGPTILPSTRFDLIQNGTTFQLMGGGFGHGVGLCQFGAKTLGESGKTFSDILKIYYPQATLSAN